MFSVVCVLAAVTLVPDVTVRCERPAGWTFDVKTTEEESGVRLANVRATSPRVALPPTFKVVVSFPQLDAEYVWNPNFGCGENLVFLPWWGNVYNVARTQPLRSWFNAQEENRLTLALSELRREVTSGGGLKEEDFCLYPSFTFFAGTREPLKEYEMELRLDMRAVPFHQAIREAAAWQAAKSGGAPAEPPAAAYEPLYSTWYNFHKDVTAEAVEAECAEAARLGMKVVILDDGWQCDDIERSYQSCGDWRISTRRFPDMRAHVARVQALGMKYMMWFAMPYVGEKTEAYGKLKDKFLRYDTHMKAWVIDPRFPECRAYLRDVYLRCLRDWNIDGFKLDFVDAFGMEGGALIRFLPRTTPDATAGLFPKAWRSCLPRSRRRLKPSSRDCFSSSDRPMSGRSSANTATWCASGIVRARSFGTACTLRTCDFSVTAQACMRTCSGGILTRHRRTPSGSS